MLIVQSKQEMLGGQAHSRCHQLWSYCGQGPLTLCWLPPLLQEPVQNMSKLEKSGLCLFTWSEKGKEGSKEAQADLESHFSLDPAYFCLCLSLRWAMGFSLREGNGFWPKTTEPLQAGLCSL